MPKNFTECIKGIQRICLYNMPRLVIRKIIFHKSKCNNNNNNSNNNNNLSVNLSHLINKNQLMQNVKVLIKTNLQ